jgi:alpha-1,2-mannosyltransferase
MTNKAQPTAWLTAKRVRAYGVILTVCLWSVYLWNLSAPGLRDRSGNLKGTDFLHFYTLGTLAVQHRGSDLYNMDAQSALAVKRVPNAAGLRYLPLYPPQVSIFFAPLARLPYMEALMAWWAICVVIYAICCYGVWRACPNLRDDVSTVLFLALGFPAFFHLIAWGQTSALALACFTAAFFLLRARRDFVAGLVLGCLIFKPQLGLAAAVVFISAGAWKTVAGAVVSAVAELAVGIFYYGSQPLRQWIHVLVRARSVLPLLEPRLYQTHSLRTFWSMLLPWPSLAPLTLGLYAASAIAALAFTIAIWKRGEAVPLALRFSALLLTTVLIAPHLTVYDLLILAPMLLLLADWAVGQEAHSSQRWLGNFLFLIYLLPLLGPFAYWTHLQLSVIPMAACLCWIWHISARHATPVASTGTL